MSFENTRFVIIGASGGIGAALSRRLKSHGAQPILLGLSAAKLALLGEELGAQTQALDASKAGALENAVAAFGPINGIVNCAGSILLKPAHLTTEAEWDQTIEAARLRTLLCASQEFSTILELEPLVNRIFTLTRQLIRYDAIIIASSFSKPARIC